MRRFEANFASAPAVTAVAANKYEAMNENQLLISLESKLSQAQQAEATDDADAFAKTTAHPNDQDCSISESDNSKGT